MRTLDIAPLRESSTQTRLGTARRSQGISQFYLRTHTFIRNRNEPYLSLPSQLPRYSFTDPGGMKGWVGLGGWLRSISVRLLFIARSRGSRSCNYRPTALSNVTRSYRRCSSLMRTIMLTWPCEYCSITSRTSYGLRACCECTTPISQQIR